MTSQHIPETLAAYPIPGVFVTSSQEYSTYVQRWETYAANVSREIYLLKNKIAGLENAKDNLESQRETLQQIVSKQRELIFSLERDLEHQITPSTTQFGVPVPESGTSSPEVTFESGTYPPPPDLLALVETEADLTPQKRTADVDIGPSSKRQDRESYPAASS
ncbi:hypothetical protein C8A00DRAFT_18711 [Chaetomidium leptoderma]|uniref:Uncharacterized protein n=1 Tax=Chaetomidium leptoderma TaxID=669021 RepID=A0AAN6VEZ5_9PEZI|nr:hypothetical protein C8A00DRAFT_18711 [Chaetomidium leptoderma]